MLPANAVQAAQHMLLPYLLQASVVVDATAGNGKDTLFLAKNTLSQAAVWAFDIQPSAIENTSRILAAAGLAEKVRLIQASHDTLGSTLNQPIDAVMFNLGYLPGSDRHIATQPNTTLAAVEQAAHLLTIGGLMTIVVYPGHASGILENQVLQQFLSTLPQQNFSVACWSMQNQINNPPLLYAVEKRRELRR
ncbi:rRNA methyltransferase [Anaerosporomusa subterranea]|uniref:rRNA methyltransferase n=1 Tax=Anaerosporomusa subterranea TaxID=1794912 RepID=A0A154BU12_ANASB|nr:class I SAM-dependent methyltransferase [Anaerosporomusa subterranea]KYZ77514.1 rRNA methyltransferase [Anaerosporomusa subterranea]